MAGLTKAERVRQAAAELEHAAKAAAIQHDPTAGAMLALSEAMNCMLDLREEQRKPSLSREELLKLFEGTVDKAITKRVTDIAVHEIVDSHAAGFDKVIAERAAGLHRDTRLKRHAIDLLLIGFGFAACFVMFLLRWR